MPINSQPHARSCVINKRQRKINKIGTARQYLAPGLLSLAAVFVLYTLSAIRFLSAMFRNYRKHSGTISKNISSLFMTRLFVLADELVIMALLSIRLVGLFNIIIIKIFDDIPFNYLNNIIISGCIMMQVLI